MKMTVNRSMFHDAFRSMGRADQFSYAARDALFDWIEEREDDLGEEQELDVIALCCDWAEYDDVIEAAEAYGWAPGMEEDEAGSPAAKDMRAELCEEAADWLRDRTEVIEVEGGSVLVLQF